MSPRHLARLSEHDPHAAPRPKQTYIIPEPEPLHPTLHTITNQLAQWDLPYCTTEADLLIHAARDHLGHHITDYPYRPEPINWQTCHCDLRYHIDNRTRHPLNTLIAHTLFPFAWESHNSSPHWLTVIGIETIRTHLTDAFDWPERTDPRP